MLMCEECSMWVWVTDDGHVQHENPSEDADHDASAPGYPPIRAAIHDGEATT